MADNGVNENADDFLNFGEDPVANVVPENIGGEPNDDLNIDGAVNNEQLQASAEPSDDLDIATAVDGEPQLLEIEQFLEELIPKLRPNVVKNLSHVPVVSTLPHTVQETSQEAG